MLFAVVLGTRHGVIIEREYIHTLTTARAMVWIAQCALISSKVPQRIG